MTVKSSANSVILILFAISDNLSAENSKLSADSWNRGNHLFGCMRTALRYFLIRKVSCHHLHHGLRLRVDLHGGSLPLLLSHPSLEAPFKNSQWTKAKQMHKTFEKEIKKGFSDTSMWGRYLQTFPISTKYQFPIEPNMGITWDHSKPL